MDRDTDADWRHIGDTEPFWGVLTSAEFRRESLNDESLKYFYDSGKSDIAGSVALLARSTGRVPPFQNALDIGCGTGRLSEAMREHAEAVTGYDISPGMLAAARRRSGRVTYTATLPAGTFDWINSYIVFQHIPPEKGYALLDEALALLAPGGVVTLHFTVARHAKTPPPPASDAPGRGKSRLRWLIPNARIQARPDPDPLGSVKMYDYDLNALLTHFRRGGVMDVSLSFVDHGGHYGYIFAGARRA